MAKQWSTIDFTESYTTGNTYDSTKNSIFGGLEVTNGVIRVPLPRVIPYLEQGNGALLANSVYADSNYIYTVTTMATGLTVRVNRWNKKTQAGGNLHRGCWRDGAAIALCQAQEYENGR